MRASLVAILLGASTVVGAAQSVAPEPGQVPPLPPIGLPLPSIGLPHPPMGLPAVARPQLGGTERGPRGHRRPGHRPHEPQPAYYFVPVLLWPVIEAPPPAAASRTSAPAHTPTGHTGLLRLDVQPAHDAQVFINGVYQGLLPDVEDGLVLDAGPHALEIRASGFDLHTMTVSVVADRTTRYRATLTPSAPLPSAAERPVPSPKTPTTFYEIPGCYLGNVPPADVDLPPGCDLSRSRTITR